MPLGSSINKFFQRNGVTILSIVLPLLILTIIASTTRQWFWIGVVLPLIKILIIIATASIFIVAGMYSLKRVYLLDNDHYKKYFKTIAVILFSAGIIVPIIFFLILFGK